MMADLTLLVLSSTILATAIGLAFFFRPSSARFGSRLPPGPAPTNWFVGNRNQVPAIKPWRWFEELNRQYGDVVYLQLGRTPTIILGSAKVAWDILEKKSAITSSRPRFIMGQELMSNNLRGLMAGYTPFWRRWRKVLHGAFMQKSSDTYKPIQSLESKQLVLDLLTTPHLFAQHLERYAASVVVTLTYGRRVVDINEDEVVRLNRETQEFFTSINIPGKYLVESLPILLYLPNFLTPWRTRALQQRQIDIEYLTRLVKEVKTKIAEGRAPPSFCRTLLEDAAKNDMSELEVAYTCATPFAAGVDTSSASILSFMLACAAFGPTFIPRAQKELDAVVGRDRLPTYEDYQDLPFVRAVVNETLRWRPVAVLGGTPHATTEAFEYNGMVIPEGATIIANLWGIHMNPADFPNPHQFDPNRFMEKRDYPGPWQHSAFGWGRRVCPGMHLAANSVFINIARILWAFDVRKATDANGKEVPVDIFAYTDGFNSMPKPFKVSIVPRSPAHAAVIVREHEAAQEELKAYEQ